jgi:ribulose-phosphate 3-epimerase
MSGRPVAIAAALRAADLADLAAEVAAVEGAGADLVHLDLCVPAAACPMLGPALCRALRPHVLTRLDLHLAGLPDPALLAACVGAGPDGLIVGLPGGLPPPGLLRAIRAAGAAPGMAVPPGIDPGDLGDLGAHLDLVDTVLLPGPATAGTVAALAAAIGGRPVALQVEGGIAPDSAAGLVAAGADVLVAGRAVFAGGHAADPSIYAQNIRDLRRAARCALSGITCVILG